MLLLVAMLACGPTPTPSAGSQRLPRTEEPLPCDPNLSTTTRVSVPTGVAVVDRFEGQRLVGHVVVALEDVVGLEHRRVPPRCSAIYLHLADGRRLLFDDATVDLGARTRRLAEFVGIDPAAVAEVVQAP